MAAKLDKELEQFRGLMEVPSSFDDGFSWSSLLGAVFIALIMVPGAIYMDLLAGGGMGGAAQWVTVILFIEVAKRAHRYMNKSEIYVLFYMAAAAMGAPFSGLLWNQFYMHSDAATTAGIVQQLPRWFAPPLESTSYATRTFFHYDWMPVIGMVIFGSLVGSLSNAILGYGLFRLTSDVEKLPFPMAPIGAQGILAVAEDSEDATSGKKDETRWRWRVFSIGGAIGLAFGSIYLFLPTLTGAMIGKSIQIFPIPFSDFTAKTQDLLKAVPTGLNWDLGNLIVGMVFPFWAMVGSFAGMIIMMVGNPILYYAGILKSWVPGDDTVTTLFKNNIDFYFSFGIGVSAVIALIGIIQVVRALIARKKEAGVAKVEVQSNVSYGKSKGRGDIRVWIIFACYFIVTMSYIVLSGWLINWHTGVMIVLFILGFVYTPVISYVTARLEGMVGQVVEIPFVREASLILSGFHGVQCWFLPLPMANYGFMVRSYRECELTGTKFTSLWKTQVALYPIILLSSIFFMNFIWGLAEVPSAVYPFAQKMWELNAQNATIVYTSTLGEYSMFEEAWNIWYLICGAGIGGVLFASLSALGAPVFLVYGIVRGLGQAMPHYIIPQFIGALIGHFYFQKKMELTWRQYIPVVSAGYFCGTGLITTIGVGITFLSKAVIQLPF